MSFCTDGHLSPVQEAIEVPVAHSPGKTRQKLRVLFVTPFLPSPPTFGAQRRLHELISGVARSNEVSVLSLVDPNENQEEAIRATEEYCHRVVTVSNPTYHGSHGMKRLRQLASLGSLHSYEWWGHSEEPFRAALEQMLLHPFDVVHFELAPMAGYAATCARGNHPTRPILCLDEHNIEYDIVRRTAAAGADPIRRFYSALEWRKVRREERHAWTHLDGCTVTSVRDQQMLLADEPAAHTAVVPNGVDLEFFDATPPVASNEPPSLLFFGAIDYFPNTDAMTFFLHDVFPRLTVRHPNLRLSIVGRKPPEFILAQKSANVEVTGVVDDIRPWMRRADVVIAPLRIGGGTRLKILEAMSSGKAVVSTTLGAEGLSVVHGRHLLIADDPEGFAVEIGRVLDDAALRARLGAAARELVVSEYSWARAVGTLSDFYGELIEARAIVQ